MKRTLTAILTVAVLALTAVPSFAVTAPYVCPNGNAACVQNGACLANGACATHETCVENGICKYPQGCPKGGVPKRDGTGGPNGVRGGGHGRGHGASHCGGGRDR